MSTNATNRSPREKNPYEVDLTIPLDKKLMSKEYEDNEDCFGKMWSATAQQCASCAVNEICCILYKDHLNKEVAERNKVEKYFDLADFTLVDEEQLILWLSFKTKTVDELYDYVAKKSNSDDEIAIVEWIKRFIKKNENIYTEGGVVKFKKTDA